MLKKKAKISFLESLVLIVFIGMVLFIPLFALQMFGSSWDVVTWRNPSDMSMLEWSSAFIHVFLFLLLFEQFYTGRRFYFILIGCAFLNMGLVNFVYALISPGTEVAFWIRFYSFFIGGVLTLSAIPFRKSLRANVHSIILKLILPSVFVSALVILCLLSFKQILPNVFIDGNTISVWGKIVFLIPCMFFFISAIIWLHEYIKEKKRIDFLFTVVFLIYAQILLLMRDASSWGIIWWLLHILLLVNVLIACIYMLVLCVYRSLVWKLIFSLGLAFSLTVMISSAIIQRYYEKEFVENFSMQLHEKHKTELLRTSSLFYAIDPSFDNLRNCIQTLPEGNRGKCNLSKLKDKLTLQRKSMNSSFLQFGFISLSGDQFFLTRNNFLMRDSLNADLHAYLLKYINQTNSNPFQFWTPFYYDANFNAWVVTFFKFLPSANNDISRSGYGFCTMDVSKIKDPDIIKRNDLTMLGGCIVFDRNNEQLLFSAMPGDYGFGNKLKLDDRSLNTEDDVRPLLASVIDLGIKGTSRIITYKGRQYFLSANIAMPLDWIVINIIDLDNFPDQAVRSRYFFIAVGMITMLIGFTVLMILLRYLLSIPLRKILHATKELENENFDAMIEINDKTEFGVIANSFNHMVKKLKVLYSHLSTIVVEKSRALDEVEKTNNAKISFFQNVSHELRTPMHGIISFARLGMNLKIDDSHDKTKKYFYNINKSAERLMNMINSILDLAKLESGHMKLNFSNSSMKNLFSQIIEEFKASLIEKDLSVNMIADEQTYADMDVEMIGHVIRNILGNALKMSPVDSEILIYIHLSNEHVIVRICDHGPGIPINEIHNIFDKFVQVGEGEKHGGTGLGLSLCREIILAHNGSIRAENKADGGACFIFTIPESQNLNIATSGIEQDAE